MWSGSSGAWAAQRVEELERELLRRDGAEVLPLPMRFDSGEGLQMARNEKTDRAARTFEWLRSLQSAVGAELSRKLDKGDGRNLRPLDLCVAVSLTGWFDADLKCFRSQAAIAEDVDRMMISGLLPRPEA